MQTEFRINGKLQLFISKPEGPVQVAAFEQLQDAITKGNIKLLNGSADAAIVLSVEG